VFDLREIEIDVPYDRLAAVRRLVAPPDVVILEETFAGTARFRLAVRASRLPALERELEEGRIEFKRVGGA